MKSKVECCDEEATLVTLSVNIQYWYCKKCKLEVDPEAAAKAKLERERKQAAEEYNAWITAHGGKATDDSDGNSWVFSTTNTAIPGPRIAWF